MCEKSLNDVMVDAISRNVLLRGMEESWSGLYDWSSHDQYYDNYRGAIEYDQL